MGKWAACQDIPHHWIEHDIDLLEALSDIGIVDDDVTTRRAAGCQDPRALPQERGLLRAHDGHAESQQRTPGARAEGHCTWDRTGAALGNTDVDPDLAPIIVHVELGRIGPFLLGDTHYRNQFETQTTGGLLCKATRMSWEHDLFGGAYDEAEAFERPKYGVMDVMNDPRGALCARTMAIHTLSSRASACGARSSPEDSGGMCASQLAVLDQYAHVLLEYGETELWEVVRVANAPEGTEERIGDSSLLEDCRYKEAQIHGEVRLDRHVARLVAHDR
eukprot:CAMPEP_0175316642 /NCGR_PEP_ID=MMETSP0093-20121207/69518_1 /TAXON_ID=311494 /ORGANISM="Alexandrium monilatum, Strain CCMP3105" /LENGTH=275 /DNA_ID=CAMNT_0016613413 /DNA_START=1 /DNA_END=825 /DNA_ORIENTATION=-